MPSTLAMDNQPFPHLAVGYSFAAERRKPCPITLVSGKTSVVIVGGSLWAKAMFFNLFCPETLYSNPL